VICPKCGEDNSDNFRFCGMCGTLLETPRSTSVPSPNLPFSRSANPADLARPVIADNAPTPKRQVPASAPVAVPAKVPAISGPSMLGLDQAGPSRSELGQRVGNETNANPPSIDALREKSFSGLDSFFEQEQPKSGGFRILLLVGLLAALGVAGWWTYTNYLGVTGNRKAEVTTSNSTETPAETQPAKPEAKDSTTPGASTPPAAVSSTATPAGQTEDANANSNANPDGGAQPADAVKPVAPAPAAPATSVRSSTVRAKRISPAEKLAAKREAAAAARAAKQPPAATDTGDADFRKAEGYLYGRGAAENCNEAVKYLKAASAKSNAKARSTFGTMYATGHCATRDLPTSYLWFALALRADPNNQILEKDLNAIWNQMTPPERQQATRMKQ
jgi:cytoskeletal protein RodZ